MNFMLKLFAFVLLSIIFGIPVATFLMVIVVILGYLKNRKVRNSRVEYYDYRRYYN